jgi:hypothetical protein
MNWSTAAGGNGHSDQSRRQGLGGADAPSGTAKAGARARGAPDPAPLDLLIRGIRQVGIYLHRRRACLRVSWRPMKVTLDTPLTRLPRAGLVWLEGSAFTTVVTTPARSQRIGR